MPLSAPCATCRGTGASPGTSPEVCSRCQGRGVEAESQGLFSISQPCRQCGGTGTEIKEPCPTCNGSGRTRQVKRYRVNIPAGVRDGSRVRLAGKGEAGPRGGPQGDLYVVTRVGDVATSSSARATTSRWRCRSRSRRRSAARRSRCPRSPATKRIRVPPGTQHGTVQRLRGEGPPKLGGRGRGDIRYRLVVDVPRSLSREQAEVVDELATVMDGNPRSRLLSGGGSRMAAGGDHDQVRGVYMISVAAELAGMHPQTLRIYEARGLITPKRSPKNTRLYSQEDVRLLSRIQELTGELGMNLAGVERVFELEAELERMQRRVRNLERHAERMQGELRAEIERVRRSVKRELVLYQPPPEALARGAGARACACRCAGPSR